jgi:hypothetical protein
MIVAGAEALNAGLCSQLIFAIVFLSELPLPPKGQGFRVLFEAAASRFLFFFDAS